jgi:hypothetical protein
MVWRNFHIKCHIITGDSSHLNGLKLRGLHCTVREYFCVPLCTPPSAQCKATTHVPLNTKPTQSCTVADHIKARDTLSSRHVSSCDGTHAVRMWEAIYIEFYNADSHICHSAYVTWSRVQLRSAHVPARLSNFCCHAHFVRRDVRVECSSDVTS